MNYQKAIEGLKSDRVKFFKENHIHINNLSDKTGLSLYKLKTESKHLSENLHVINRIAKALDVPPVKWNEGDSTLKIKYQLYDMCRKHTWLCEELGRHKTVISQRLNGKFDFDDIQLEKLKELGIIK